MKHSVLAVLFLAGSASGAVQKKYLDFGWQYRYIPPSALLANADKFKGTAIDGVSIYLTATNSLGQAFSFVSHPQRWEREAFSSQLDDLRKIARTPHLSESMFAGFKAPIKRIAWTDDKGWENFSNSMAVLGWLGRETGINALAPSFGTAHGIYKAKPVLDLERVKVIAEKTGLPLVMHGGSGVSPEDYRTGIANGLRKINYYSYMSKAGTNAVKEMLEKEDVTFFHDLALAAEKAMQADAEKAMRVFAGL